MDEKLNWNLEVSHPLQSWEWGEFRKLRQPISRINQTLVVWTKIKYTPWHFGYIPMGPVPLPSDIDLLKNEAKNHNALGIRMEPNVRRDKITNDQFLIFNKFLKPGRKLFKAKTILIDLTKSEEELLKNMHPKGRYNIKIAQKHGVNVKEDNSPEAFEKYLDLMFSGTAKRQGVYFHGREYHQQLWKVLHPAGMASLFTARYQNKILAASMVFRFKKTIYYAYGASELEHKEVMAQTLLLWEMIKWGKENGCTTFDLWGAEEGKGFSRFKERFGGTLVEMAGTWDLPVSPVGYGIFRLAEEVRWKILRLLK